MTLGWMVNAAVAQPAGPPGMALGPTEVGVVTLETANVPFSNTLPGRAVAFEAVDIRPRVGGVIAEIVYEPGRTVAAGDVLFRIEDDSFEAQLTAAEAEVARAEAALATAEQTVTRYERLEGVGVTTETLDSARVAVLQAQADLSSARASQQVAQLDLDRTEITSPITGYAAVPTVSVGALVTANQTDALTTVTRLDPIFVDVEESSRRFAQIRNRMESGSLERGGEIDIALELETGETYSGKGTLVSPGATVSTTTGTRQLRLQFDNPERRIMPGQFLRVDMTLGTSEAILVPQGATSRTAAGALTAFVAVDGRAEERTLTDQGSFENAWVVTEGVAAGEQLIVDGLSNLTDGAEVTPVPVIIGDDGVPVPADGRSEAFVRPGSAPPDGASADQDGAATDGN
ncbi:efflux RND transporter periplasmic adaptor subunit [Pseudooceanicola sp. LIPI14-2-Ac024]|uniref:efflux RND transporter periplasmic adaptor subunit n=1 Tax=Pseudooceanicola sp. LIPI14-2-Ac024 TaxID=3344875 RepID=UPI0035CF29B7